MKTIRRTTFLVLSCFVLTACASAPPAKPVTIDALQGTVWEGVWGSDGGHGMRNPVKLTVEKADLGALLGTLVISNQPFPAKGVVFVEAKDGATWIKLDVEGNRSFNLRFLGDKLEGRGKSAMHDGPVTLMLR
jgi:hypothetical protein